MEISIKTTQSVLNKIIIDGVCFAKNETSYSEYAYNYLKELTGYKGLFFGIGINDYAKRNSEHINDLTSLSNTDNVIAVTLAIPNNECYAHDYYSFSDLIFYYEEEEFDTVEIIKEELKKPSLSNVVQCVFNRIEKEWIKEIEYIKE